MIVLKTLTRAAAVIGAVSLLTLSGCAQNQTVEHVEHAAAVNEVKVNAPVTERKSPRAQVVPEQTTPDYANMNPVAIEFDKMSVKLSDADKEILEKIKGRAQKAKKLIITGYCDRKQVGNSKAAAIARAAAVKAQLVRFGVKPGAVKIKYVTTVADKHAAEITLVAPI